MIPEHRNGWLMVRRVRVASIVTNLNLMLMAEKITWEKAKHILETWLRPDQYRLDTIGLIRLKEWDA